MISKENFGSGTVVSPGEIMMVSIYLWRLPLGNEISDLWLHVEYRSQFAVNR